MYFERAARSMESEAMTQESAITINFSCVKCGSALETKDDVRTEASIVTCKSCGHEFGTYGELKAEGTRLATEKAREVLEPTLDQLSHIGFIKIK